MGVGKTGIIGHKISSSLASTGTPSIFINAAEAMHGDLGMVSKNDIVLLISNSGSSSEILNVVAPNELALEMPYIENNLKFTQLLNHLGAETTFENNTLKISSRNVENIQAPYELVKQI